MKELHELGEPIAEASTGEGAIPMSAPQLNTSLLAIDQLRSQMIDVHHYIIRTETDSTIRHQDQMARKSSLKEVNKLKEQATALKASADAEQRLSVVGRKIKLLQKTQSENPTKDYIQAALPIDSEMTLIEKYLVEAVLKEDHHLWESYETLRGRLVAILSHEITVPDTKDFSKSTSKTSYKIAPLVVPKFSGKIEHWISFWEEFNHAVNQKLDLDECTKLVYLKQSILDSSLKSTIADLGVNDTAYSAAIKLLKERFDKPRIVHRQCCEALKNIPVNTDSRASLTALADNLQHILTGLTRLKTLGASEILTSMAEMSMSKNIKHEWLTQTAKITTTPPVEQVLQFIRERADQAEGEEVVSSKPSHERNKNPKSSHHKNKGSYAAAAPTQPIQSHPVNQVASTTPTSSPQQTRGAQSGFRSEYPPCRYSCPLCPANHYAFYCDVFKGYSPRQRIQHAQTHGLCTSCLKPGHAMAECRSTFKCKTCRGQHNSLLHEEQPTVATPAVQSTNAAISEGDYRIKDTLFMTAEVLLTGSNGVTMSARAFLDNGAGLSIVSCSVRNTLALRSTGDRVDIEGVGGIAVREASPLVRIVLSSNYQKNWKTELTVAVMPKPARDIPIKYASETRDLSHIQGLTLADKNYDQPGEVDILLGQDVWDQLFLKGRILGPEGTPSARQSVFGWVVSGLYQPDKPKKALAACAYYVASTQANRISDNLLSQFWFLEEPPQPKKDLTTEEMRVEKHYAESHKYIQEKGRYEVTLPRSLGKAELGESRNTALFRARSNERSLLRKKRYAEFQTVMAEYLELGHARLVSSEDLLLPAESTYYMPIHSVVKESSTSTKVRAVFDASAATTTNVSLNDLLVAGPTIQPSLDNTLLKFRLYHVAISGDISKMYREILLSPADRSLHRFLWRADQSQPWLDYEMLRVTFGVTASPYVAIKTLQQASIDFGKNHSVASQHIKDSFYVDDFFAGASTPEKAINLRKEISDILAKAGFTIKKWRSSSTQVLQSIPSELLESLPAQELVDEHSAHYPKALGLIWDSRKDEMATKIDLPSTYPSTKRGVVSDVAKMFDILGWLSPVILQMKLLYRKLWQLKLDWDKEVPEELRLQHKEWRENLHILADVRLPRYYFSGKNPKNISLQGFSDASKEAFSAVIYIRATYASGPPSSTLVISKTRVAPLDGRSIPELELCGAHLLSKILTTTSQALSIPIEDIRAYSDSTIVLAWLDGSPKIEKIYVANRICKISKLLPTKAWGYVPSKENPADCASRGVSARELLNHPLWWHGPPWLLQQPLCPPIVSTAESRRRKEEEVATEEFKPVHSCSVTVKNTDTRLEEASTSFSTLVRITCWIFRFIARARKRKISADLRLSVEEGQRAEEFLIRRSQARTYSLELQLLTSDSTQPLPKKCHLVTLQPKINQKGILCVGGRLNNSFISEREKHPVILSPKDM